MPQCFFPVDFLVRLASINPSLTLWTCIFFHLLVECSFDLVTETPRCGGIIFLRNISESRRGDSEYLVSWALLGRGGGAIQRLVIEDFIRRRWTTSFFRRVQEQEPSKMNMFFCVKFGLRESSLCFCNKFLTLQYHLAFKILKDCVAMQFFVRPLGVNGRVVSNPWICSGQKINDNIDGAGVFERGAH